MTEIQFDKLRIGNKVKVKTDLIPGNRYGDVYFSFEMMALKGTTITIRNKRLRKSYKVINAANAINEHAYIFSREMIDYTFKFGRE